MILQTTGYVVLTAYDLCSDAMLLHIQASFLFCIRSCFGGRGRGLLHLTIYASLLVIGMSFSPLSLMSMDILKQIFILNYSYYYLVKLVLVVPHMDFFFPRSLWLSCFLRRGLSTLQNLCNGHRLFSYADCKNRFKLTLNKIRCLMQNSSCFK